MYAREYGSTKIYICNTVNNSCNFDLASALVVGATTVNESNEAT
jgi:hypothetical protein